MKITIKTGYQTDLADIAEGLNDLMADLEDIRDEAQEQADDQAKEDILSDIRRIDEAIRLLSQAADLLDGEE